MTERSERHSCARLQWRWLLLARDIWITLVILTLAIFFANLPVYVALKQGKDAALLVVSTVTGPSMIDERASR